MVDSLLVHRLRNLVDLSVGPARRHPPRRRLRPRRQKRSRRLSTGHGHGASALLDGDGKTELVVWRPSDGTWYVRFSSSNYSFATWKAYQWGLPGDAPLVADFDGDGKGDLAVWRPSDGTWYVLRSSSNYSYAAFAS